MILYVNIIEFNI